MSIGFKVSNQIGLIYSFSLKGLGGVSYVINFYGLYDLIGNKLLYRLAYRWWMNRLERYFNVIVLEKGNTS